MREYFHPDGRRLLYQRAILKAGNRYRLAKQMKMTWPGIKRWEQHGVPLARVPDVLDYVEGRAA